VSNGRVTGTLIDQRAQPVRGSQVALIPDRTRERFELYRTAITDDKGNFTISGITPGDYHVFSWEGLELNAWFDPELLARLEVRGQAVHVTDSSNETIQLRFNPTGNRQ